MDIDWRVEVFKSFFLDVRWMHWSIIGSVLLGFVSWYKVNITVEINNWYGSFYDLIQRGLSAPNTITIGEFYGGMWDVFWLLTLWIVVQTGTSFFTRHYVFRWRHAMNNYYMSHWSKLKHIEGAAQRVQEDTNRFAAIVQSLGISLLDAILTLIAFLPILYTLSTHVPALPIIGEVSPSLVYAALLSAAVGTVMITLAGIKLPGLEFNKQLVEAAYRKELVLGEDDATRASPPAVTELFSQVRHNFFRLVWHYGYFDVVRFSYIQYSIFVPLLLLGPVIVAAGITFGIYRQVIHVFDRVENSFQYLVNSWDTMVELISIVKRLRTFERHITHPQSTGDGA